MMVLRPLAFVELARQRWDVVHVVMPLNLSGVWLLAAFRFLHLFGADAPRLVVSWHCNLGAYNESIFPAGLTWITERLCTAVFCPVGALADKLLIPTPSTEPAIRAAFGDRWGICSNGLSAEAFNPEARHSPEGKAWEARKQEALQASGCSHLLLCVGRLSPEKGVADLIEALPLLPGCALWLVGDGPARPRLEHLASAAGLPVTFWGYQRGAALSAVYTVCDVFVCPSQTETFGQTVNEALASGVPVAVPRVGCFAEAYDGLLDRQRDMWSPGDARDMAAAIGRQLQAGGAREPPVVKDWATATDELLREYMTCEAGAARKGRSRAARALASGALVAGYPFFWLLTAGVTLAVVCLSLLRTALNGVGLRDYCAIKARSVKGSFKRAASAPPERTPSPSRVHDPLHA